MPNTMLALAQCRVWHGFSSDAIVSNEDRSYKMSLVGLVVMSCQALVLALMLLYVIRLAQMTGQNWWVSYNLVPGTGINFYVIIRNNP